MDAEDGSFRALARPPRRAGVLPPDMRRQNFVGDRLRNLPALVQERLAQLVEAETTAAAPFHRFGDSALFAIDDLLHPHRAVRLRVFAHLDADPPPPHLVRNRRRRAAAEKRIHHQVALVRRNRQNPLNQFLWLWGPKWHIAKQFQIFLFAILIGPGKFIMPKGHGHHALLNVGKKVLFCRNAGFTILAPIKTIFSDILLMFFL